ncbi:unnamed protein product [Rhizoctonia solani]|uniref:Uncharacterized protein n=1 Tax=Rhizoctonia solani TaxID=456999 RepID=A0A8H3GR39_9AGAM|nr:unnamed protein product [Rhizoctonia solani]
MGGPDHIDGSTFHIVTSKAGKMINVNYSDSKLHDTNGPGRSTVSLGSNLPKRIIQIYGPSTQLAELIDLGAREITSAKPSFDECDIRLVSDNQIG